MSQYDERSDLVKGNNNRNKIKLTSLFEEENKEVNLDKLRLRKEGQYKIPKELYGIIAEILTFIHQLDGE